MACTHELRRGRRERSRQGGACSSQPGGVRLEVPRVGGRARGQMASSHSQNRAATMQAVESQELLELNFVGAAPVCGFDLCSWVISLSLPLSLRPCQRKPGVLDSPSHALDGMPKNACFRVPRLKSIHPDANPTHPHPHPSSTRHPPGLQLPPSAPSPSAPSLSLSCTRIFSRAHAGAVA